MDEWNRVNFGDAGKHDNEPQDSEDSLDDKREENENCPALKERQILFKFINGIKHHKEMVLVDGIERELWVNENGDAGPPVNVAETPPIGHKKQSVPSPHLQLSSKIGELVEAHKNAYEVRGGNW